VQGLELLPVPGEGPIASLDSPPRLGRRHLEPHDDVPTQRPPHALRAHRASAQRDRASLRILEELAHLGLLEVAELLLPPLAEEPGNRHPELALEKLVGLHRGEPGFPRRLRGGGLSRAHEAHEDDRGQATGLRRLPGSFPLYRRHPIRRL
jgi:hypothetical protein